MPCSYPVPPAPTVEQLICGLLPVEAHVTVQEVADPARDATGVFAEFVNGDEALSVLAYADHEMANLTGGAIMEVPDEVVAEANTKGVTHEACVEGFGEIVNVFASCLNSDYTPHLRLGQVIVLPGQLSDEVKHLWREPRARRSYKVSVEGQGSGTVILYMS